MDKPAGYRLRRLSDRDVEVWPVWAAGLAGRGLFLYTPLLSYALSGPAPYRLRVTPQDPLSGNGNIGRAILNGTLPGRGGTSPVGQGEPWAHLSNRSLAHQRYVHSFDWMRDLMAAPDAVSAETLAVRLIRDWVERYFERDSQAWHPQSTARRLISWISCARLVTQSAAQMRERNAINAMARQARHLRLIYPRRGQIANRMEAVAALLMTALALDMPDLQPKRLSRELRHILRLFVQADGGPLSRRPGHALRTLRLLTILRDIYRQLEKTPPAWLDETIALIVPFVAALRLGDGALISMNGGSGTTPEQVTALLEAADAAAPPRLSAEKTGFERLEAGDAVCVVDTGPPPPPGLSAKAAAGTLSFEMSDGATPLVVNMGSASRAGLPAKLALVARSTAAHSTLVIGDTNSTQTEAGGLRRGVETVTVRRAESEEGSLLDLSHDGYRHRFGVRHERQLFLSPGGARLTGIDRLTPVSRRARTAARVDVRFHLHPGLTVTLSSDGQSALLAHKSGLVWRFRADGRAVKAEDSLFIDGVAGPIRTKQLIVRFEADPLEAVVRWVFERVQTA